ncbi:hypothetical protein BDA96_10G314900 [Sorghum bicolor]|uniref:C2H2-type domain-containing protein n=2 Tax=Sorghum bicolor TaxID=4558 RepID=A0A194YLA0_SORBI|nr:uncharacterized protein LOC110431279 [Sorghum bicolor]XP_021305906.1 uncharacterized protein LOC110431279 [Sorghum bicolor]KAG0515878.1 hypothetical protein BDA96_10G314900 [Sorghum bicolor]KXG20722.1 hypothetical protein SORBI_3010G243400 [Sorghum bicolor]OQU76964.1 hypothetical protein SORBI_3010G243400 [Sorghum bicolor]|eukprot:XP_021305905.1 uncharacterized protein LOC110431279 [Sorghum bicolor]
MGSGNLIVKKVVKHSSFDLDIQLDKSWMEDVTCPICLDYPHNAVLLRCTSYEKGCRPFVCDTDQTRSNCLERFKFAYELPSNAKVSSLAVPPLDSIIHIVPSNANNRPSCPLCRGDVIGWIVIGEARLHLNQKKRCCEEDCCSFVGNFNELQKHTQQKHPDSRPSEIDPARQVDWENFQQSSDIVDVLSTIHAQVPNGIVLGDYVIEYGDDDTGEDYEVFRSVRTNWWSCIFCKAFSRSSRSRRRARARERRGSGRRNGNQANLENFNLEVPTQSVELREIRFDEIDDEYIVTGAIPSIAAPGRMASFHYRDTRYGR